MDNAVDGFDLYNLETGLFMRNFPTGIPKKRYPKQVAFGEDARVVVGGSDHGAVYVFDRKTGKTLDVLFHAEEGRPCFPSDPRFERCQHNCMRYVQSMQ